jgi:hypothetical protein
MITFGIVISLIVQPLKTKDIITPPRIKSRGRPKGSEMTTIGLPKKRKTDKKPTLFIHKSPNEKAQCE